MFKSFFVGVCVISIIILISLEVMLFQNNRRKGVYILMMMPILGIVMNASLILSLYSEDRLGMALFYTTTLVMEQWILLLFLRYTRERAVLKYSDNKVLNALFILSALVVDVLWIVNIFTQQFVTFEKIEKYGTMLTVAHWSPLFMIHFAGCLIVAVLIALAMAFKAHQVASIYRIRYIFGAVIFSLWLVLEMTTRFTSGNINHWSVLLVTVGTIGYFFMYFIYPRMRIEKMKTFAINNISDPVLMFDYNNNLQVYNDAAERMLGVEYYYTIERYIRENELYYTMEEHTNSDDKNHEFTRTKMVASRNYLIHGKALRDKKGKFVGTLVIYTDITNQEKLKDEATLYATRDQLTGLWNRDYFFEMVSKTIYENPDVEFNMIVSDIYHFKMFNEILGNATGDDLLMAIAQGYREKCKRLWVFSRIAGDRYGLLMPKADFREKEFMEYVRTVFDRKHYELKVHCYVGVYEITDRYISAESMYTRAYMALESIKGDLQKTVAYYHEEIRNKRIFETTTLDELDRALLNNEFVIFLQPQIDIQTDAVVSAEALIRWKKPGRGIIPPSEFIPIFENNGMIAKLDYHVWELACRQLHIWKNEGYGNRSISVNISAKDFYLADLYDSITGLVERYKINPKNLKLEITETAFVLDVRKQMELVRKLQDYGFVIEIDDFGSGYSSLNSLKDICVDVLKMDMKFFEKSDEIGRAEKIVQSVVTLANNLGMPVVAEGVETQEDLEMLHRVGCQIIQGYFYSKPLSVEDYEAFLKTRAYGDMDAIIAKVREGK